MKSTLSSKGQVTIPVEVRDRLGLAAGTPVLFEFVEGGVLIRKGTIGAHPVDQLFGVLKADGQVAHRRARARARTRR